MGRKHRDIIDDMAALSAQERGTDMPADDAGAQQRADNAERSKHRWKVIDVIGDVIEGIVEIVIDIFT